MRFGAEEYGILRSALCKKIAEKLEETGHRPLNGEKKKKLFSFIEDLLWWSDRIHLLGKRNIEANIERQISDSAYILRFLKSYLDRVPANGMSKGPGARSKGGKSFLDGIRVADIGSGAGFPALVWKILHPELDITLFERKQKAAAFLTRETNRLDLKGAKVFACDAAAYSPEGRFEIVTSKAAGKLPEIMPVVSMLLSEGGIYTTLKGEGWRKKEQGEGFTSMKLEKADDMPEGRGVAVIYRKTAG